MPDASILIVQIQCIHISSMLHETLHNVQSTVLDGFVQRRDLLVVCYQHQSRLSRHQQLHDLNGTVCHDGDHQRRAALVGAYLRIEALLTQQKFTNLQVSLEYGMVKG